MKPIYMAVGINPVTDTVILLGMAGSDAEAKEQLKRADEDTIYRQTFHFNSPELAKDMHAWIRSCGICGDDAQQIIKAFAELIMKISGKSSHKHKKGKQA